MTGLEHKVAYLVVSIIAAAQDTEGQRSGRRHGWLLNGCHKAALWPLHLQQMIRSRAGCPVV